MTEPSVPPSPHVGDALRAIQEVRDYAIFLLDPDGTVASWNEGARAIKGYSSSEILGQSSARFYLREDVLAGRPAALLARAAKEGRVEDEGWRVRKDGSRFWADVVITAVRDQDGGLLGFIKVTRDLTERREAAERLRKSEERLQLLVASVKDYAIFMLDLEGRISTWNAGAERMKGYRAEEVVGRHISLFYPPEDVERGKPAELLRRVASEGRVEDESWRVRKDGTRFWADVVITRVDDKAGKPIGFGKVTRDLTDRKQAEEAVAERARQQAATAELGLFALQERDLDAVIGRAIETVRETLGTEMVNVLELSEDGSSLTLRAGCGVDSSAIGHATIQVDLRSQAGYTLLSSEPVQLDRKRFRLAGIVDDERVAGGITALIRAAERPRGAYGVLGAHTGSRRAFTGDDVSFLQSVANVIAAAIERRRMEEHLRAVEQKAQEELGRTIQAREALRERDEFISVAAHELRTPLTALQLKLQGLEQGFKSGLREKAGARTIGTRLDGALRQTERLSMLIERLLDVSRIAAGRLELAPEPFDLAALLRQVVDDFRDPAAAAGSELRLDAPAAVEGCWDRLRLEQVLVNLLSNAVKYGAGRPISVRLETTGERVRIAVADEGIGIAEQDLARLFSRFERAAPVRNYGGLGLGLYISRHIVDAHGGRIEVSSRPGLGSTFAIDLPLDRAQVPGPEKDQPQARA